MAEPQLPKLMVWVRFPSSAPLSKSFVLTKDFFIVKGRRFLGNRLTKTRLPSYHGKGHDSHDSMV